MQTETPHTTTQGFKFDINKCVGCQACVLACQIENQTTVPFNWRSVYPSNELHISQIPLFHLSLACNHCEGAPCMKNCPAQAYSRDPLTNAIIIDSKKCIGCSYCSWVCPYDAPKLNNNKGYMEKCNFCTHKLAEGEKPACALNCPVGALDYGNIEEQDYTLVPGFTDTGINPKIQFLNTEKSQRQPEIDPEVIKGEGKPEYHDTVVKEKINIRQDWILAVFTLLVSIMVGFYTASLPYNDFVNPHVFFIVGAIAAAFSLFHLKKPQLAWRALLHVKNSWLSREIWFFLFFLIFAFLGYYLIPIPKWIKITAVLMGFATLLSMDQLYRKVTLKKHAFIHSAESVYTALMFFLLLTAFNPVILLAIKNAAYLHRKVYRKNAYHEIINAWTLSRLSFGLFIPLSIDPSYFYIFMISIVIGELIDRLEFYKEMEVINPAKDILNESNPEK